MKMNSDDMRKAFVKMMEMLNPQYCLTLNLNRDFGDLKPTARLRKAEKYFEKFCYYLDRRTIGSRCLKHEEQRAIIIVAPEHIETNFHYHGGVKFRGARRIETVEAREKVLSAWKDNIPSGTVMVETTWDKNGWSEYINKERCRPGWIEDVLISSVYWPR